MRQELADFLDYCRVERRLAPLTCSAYERDVGTCVDYLEREGLVTVGEVRPLHLRRFLTEESVRRPALQPGAGRRRAQVLLPLPGGDRANRPRPCARPAHAEEARGAPGRA